MGKRIIARARGKGGPRYRTPGHRFLGRVRYIQDKGSGRVIDIVHDPGRSAPVAIVKVDGQDVLHIASQGLMVDQTIEYDGEVQTGNILELSKIPVGTKIFGIETCPGSGPKFCRSSGSFAVIMNKTKDMVTVKFSSGKTKDLNPRSRATIGVPANGGRLEKPWVKAGKKVKAMAARGRLYPRTKGVAMGPVNHPYGGRKKAPRPSKSSSRNAPPGAKVGSIAPRRTGVRRGR